MVDCGQGHKRRTSQFALINFQNLLLDNKALNEDTCITAW